MKICILDDFYEQSTSPLKEHDIACDPRPFLLDHDCHRAILHRSNAVRRLIELSARNFDVYINLCDGAWDEDRPGIEVVQTLERLGLAFTGAASDFYEPSREAMKRVCYYYGIGAPAYVMARTDLDMERAADTLRFPLIVKHPSSYSSIGMTRDSRLESSSGLRDQCRLMISQFGAALVEEFIEGREFTVLVAENPDSSEEPIAYQPIEFHFPPGESFKHFHLKWVDYHGMRGVPCTDPVLIKELQQISGQLFTGLRGSGYGRCDIRMNAKNELFMLEINPNCGIFYPLQDAGSADLVLLNDPAGHSGFVEQILRAALARQKRRRRCWEVRFDSRSGYGLFATEAISTGNVIESYEESPYFLVTRGHVERHWGERRRSWFERYAYPISDDVWVIWSPDPEDWRPLNHSCDPNSWLQGLNLNARRDIAAGEEITIDYATFCGKSMADFQCHCGESDCRGRVSGSDTLRDVIERYGNHVSDYVRNLNR